MQPLVAQIGRIQNLIILQPCKDRRAAGGDKMSVIEDFCDARVELANLNREAVDLASRIQADIEELAA